MTTRKRLAGARKPRQHPTKKQLAFCSALREQRVSGKEPDPVAAYRAAGYVVYGDKRDSCEAWHLLETPAIKALLGDFLERDRKAAEAEHDVTRDWVIRQLKDAMAIGRRQDNSSGAAVIINGAAQLCKMLGFDAPQKHELAGKDGGPIRYELSDGARDILGEVVGSLHDQPGNGATKH